MSFGTFRSNIKIKLRHVSIFVEKIVCSKDSAWNHGEEGRGKHKIKCKFCNRATNGGITKLKQHLAYKQG